ncbi:FACT complex subunit [Marasmius tenuissimus]|uniref:FACT complex subunit n=1 Tax=Marasmius tenuissimus TaxID=585030 RepID=A0ABR2ZT68_9AGAR
MDFLQRLGKFRIAASGMAWKKSDSEGIASRTAAVSSWNSGYMSLGIFIQGLKMGNEQRKDTFDSFAPEDHDGLATLHKNHFSVTLETREISLKGKEKYDSQTITGQNLVFTVSDKTAFELPLQHVVNPNIAGKTKVSLDCASPPTSSKKGGDKMMRIRLYEPGSISKFKGSDAGYDAETENDDEEISAAELSDVDKAVSPVSVGLAFTKVNKDGHEPTESYLEKKIRLKNKMVAGAELLAVTFADDDDEDDGDMRSISSGSNRPVNSSHAAMDNDEDSEEDEEFEASPSDSGSPNESNSSEGDAMDVDDKPNPKPQPKGTRRDDAMDVDGEDKPQPKPRQKASDKNTNETPKKNQKTSD